jgi:heme/copper-type cytochrome/quinol oxidase subunit 3
LKPIFHRTKEHKIKFIIVLSSPLSLFGLILISGFVAVTARIDDAVLDVLIQAEATIIGFFGAVFIFAITSLGRRIDEREKQITNIKINALDQYTLINHLNGQIDNIQKNFGDLVNAAIFTGILLFSSFLCSALSLGLRTLNEDLTFLLAGFSVTNLILGFIMILSIVYDMKVSPGDLMN